MQFNKVSANLSNLKFEKRLKMCTINKDSGCEIRRIGFYRLENAMQMCLNQISGNVSSNVSSNVSENQEFPAKSREHFKQEAGNDDKGCC